MSTDAKAVVTPKVEMVTVSTSVPKGSECLVITLTQASYDFIKEVVERATDRGLESAFEHWFADAIKAGTQARLRTWNDRDVVTMFKQASQGNAKAIAKLQKLIGKTSVSQ